MNLGRFLLANLLVILLIPVVLMGQIKLGYANPSRFEPENDWVPPHYDYATNLSGLVRSSQR